MVLMSSRMCLVEAAVGLHQEKALTRWAMGLLPWQSCLMANTLYLTLTTYNLPITGVSVLPLQVSSEARGQRTGLKE